MNGSAKPWYGRLNTKLTNDGHLVEIWNSRRRASANVIRSDMMPENEIFIKDEIFREVNLHL